MKRHEDKDFLTACLEDGMSSKDISKLCKVSVHLVEIHLRRHGLKYTPWAKQKDGVL